jgi:hypothetical protein
MTADMKLLEVLQNISWHISCTLLLMTFLLANIIKYEVYFHRMNHIKYQSM